MRDPCTGSTMMFQSTGNQPIFKRYQTHQRWKLPIKRRRDKTLLRCYKPQKEWTSVSNHPENLKTSIDVKYLPRKFLLESEFDWTDSEQSTVRDIL